MPLKEYVEKLETEVYHQRSDADYRHNIYANTPKDRYGSSSAPFPHQGERW